MLVGTWVHTIHTSNVFVLLHFDDTVLYFNCWRYMAIFLLNSVHSENRLDAPHSRVSTARFDIIAEQTTIAVTR